MLAQPLIPRADHNISLTIPGACERLAKAVRDSTDRHLLIKVVEKAPVAGVIDLTHGDFAGVFTDTFRAQGAINTAGVSTAVFFHVPTLDALKADFPVDETCVWYHERGSSLIFRNPVDGLLNNYIQLLRLAGSYIPEIGNAVRPMVHELDDQLVDRATEIVQQAGGLQFLTMDPQKAAAQMSR